MSGSHSNLAFLQTEWPALSRSQIQVLLREMRRDGAVHPAGVTKGARWYPGPMIATKPV